MQPDEQSGLAQLRVYGSITAELLTVIHIMPGITLAQLKAQISESLVGQGLATTSMPVVFTDEKVAKAASSAKCSTVFGIIKPVATPKTTKVKDQRVDKNSRKPTVKKTVIGK